MGFLWHVMSTSSSLYTVTPSLVKMDTLPLSDVLPTLISDVGNYVNMPASAALLENCGNCSVVTYLPLQALPLDTTTFCLIFSISVGLTLFCPFCWFNVCLRPNRRLTLVYCRVDGTWIWKFFFWIVRAYLHVWWRCCACGSCAGFLPHLRSLVDCCFVHDVAPIIYYCDGGIDDCCVIIHSLDYSLVYLGVHLFLAPYGWLEFEFALCACGLVYLTRIDRELC